MGSLFFRNPRAFLLAVGVIVALAAASLTAIGRQEDPTITNLFATIVTPYPGADPARVEALVTEKIEEQLREIPEIEEITSVSRTGVSVVQVELSQFLPDAALETAWSEIRDALSDAALNFPAGVPEPEFDDDRTGAFTSISAVALRPGVDPNPAILNRFAEKLQDRLRGVPGTKIVELFGEAEEEIRVTVDPVRLVDLGLSADRVSAAIAAADSKVRAGQVRGPSSDMVIEVAGEIASLQRVRDVPLGTGPDGSLVRVGDVALVERAVASPRASLAYADGAPAVLVAAQMEPDRQVDAWAAAVRRAVAEFEETLPGGIEHRLLFDQSAYTADRFAELGLNLGMGVGLVVAVLFLTLGWRSALVVAASIPLATLMSVTVMLWAGITVHQMSATGLIVALGLLVDAVIVMTDDIRRRREEGESALLAVTEGVRRLAVPLAASTVTTVLAFLPMAALPGPAGDFVGSIALSVIIMLGSSLVLALTLVPAMSGWFVKPAGRGGFLASGLSLPWLGRAFERSLDLALRHRMLSVLAALALPVVGFGAFPTLTAQFFPGVDRDQFHVQLRLAGGSSVAETERAALEAGRIIAAAEGVRHVHWVIGESAPSFYYNMMRNQDGVASFAEALVTTASPEDTARVVPELQAALDRALPGALTLVRPLVQGPPVAAPVELRLVGPDLEVLRDLGEDVRAAMARAPSITHTKADLLGGEPKLVVDLDEDRVRLAGLDLATVARHLDATLEGASGGSLVEGPEELPVRVRVGDGLRSGAADLRAIDVPGPQAADGLYPGVPLSALGEVRLVPSDSPIARRNGERVNTVQAYIVPGVLPEEALKAVMATLEETPLDLPAGYRLEVGGDADARAETTRNLTSTLGLVMTLTVVTVVLTFGSYRLSLIAFAVCVLSFGLAFLALAVFQHPFGIQALIGSIGSIGVSINAAIIVLTALRDDPAAASGDLRRIREVVAAQGRHIVSTTVTTVGGFLPLILAGGGFWPPFAMAIAGGVSLSVVLAFYFTPPLFAMTAVRRARRRPAAAAAPAGAPARMDARLIPVAAE